MTTQGKPDMTHPGKYEDGVPCNHSGCLSHVTHPCEGCGRVAGRYQPPMRKESTHPGKQALERAVELAKKAEGGEWKSCIAVEEMQVPAHVAAYSRDDQGRKVRRHVADCAEMASEPKGDANAEYIAHLHNSLSSILEYVEQVEKESADNALRAALAENQLAERERAIERLKAYAQHTAFCVTMLEGGARCDCGYVQALTEESA